MDLHFINMNTITKIEELIREILNSIIGKIDFNKLEVENQLFRDKINNRIKTDNIENWAFITNALDIIGDSNIAISSYWKNKEKNIQNGQEYLKLYGVLSAIYIQQQAIHKLANSLKVEKIRLHNKVIKNLDIIFLRHVISAHPINYMQNEKDSTNRKKTSFKIVRNSVIGGNGKIVLFDNNSKKYEFNIYDSIAEYFDTITPLFKLVCERLIINAYGTNTHIAKNNIQKLKKI